MTSLTCTLGKMEEKQANQVKGHRGLCLFSMPYSDSTDMVLTSNYTVILTSL